MQAELSALCPQTLSCSTIAVEPSWVTALSAQIPRLDWKRWQPITITRRTPLKRLFTIAEQPVVGPGPDSINNRHHNRHHLTYMSLLRAHHTTRIRRVVPSHPNNNSNSSRHLPTNSPTSWWKAHRLRLGKTMSLKLAHPQMPQWHLQRHSIGTIRV